MYAFVLYPCLVSSLSSQNDYIIIRIQEEIWDAVKSQFQCNVNSILTRHSHDHK